MLLKAPQVHVDNYKLRLYRSLRGDSCRENEGSVPPVSYEGPVLVGYKCGNNHQAGCLTGDRNVRIHSCDKGMRCSSMNKNTVWIRPIITRTTNGSEIGEIGVAGGADDLIQKPELELDSTSRRRGSRPAKSHHFPILSAFFLRRAMPLC